jgi:amino acid transporter
VWNEAFETAAKITSPIGLLAFLGAVFLGLVLITRKKDSYRPLVLTLFVIVAVVGVAANAVMTYLSYAPESITMGFPSDISFRQAVIMIVKDDSHAARFDLCDETLLNTKLEACTLGASNQSNLIELLQYRLINPPEKHTYHVKFLKDKGIYEVHCDR